MEPPALVRWCPPDNASTNSELFDFELGGRDDSFELEEHANELRRRVVALLQERNRLLVYLRELNSQGGSSLDEELKALSECNRLGYTKDYRMKSEPGLSSSTSGNVSSSRIPGTSRDLFPSGRCTRLSQESGVEDGDTLESDTFCSEDQELISNLQQANYHLSCLVNRLQQSDTNLDWNEGTFEEAREHDVKRQLCQLVTRNKNFENLLQIEDSTLTLQLNKYLRNNLSEREILLIKNSEKNMEDVNMCNNKSMASEKVEFGVQTDGMPFNHYPNSPGILREGEKNKQNFKNGSILGQHVHEQELTDERRKYAALEKEYKDLKEKFASATAEKAKLKDENDQLLQNYGNQETAQQMHIEKLEQDVKQYQNMIIEYQAGEHTRKREVDQVLLQARDVLERERQEKFASISEQNVLKKQIENLSKTMKTMQVKNEELVRFQCNQEDQVDDFKRLKKLIQENGLPTIEQVIVLQRQNESYREDLMNERKEKERLLSIKDKLRRDLDSTQSRISSLQEQVYKYREHIYFLQQRAKQDTPGSPLVPPPPTPTFDPVVPPPSPTALANANRLYGNNAQQYINENLLQGQTRKYPLIPFPEGKKGPPGKHGVEAPGSAGKQWSAAGFPQQNPYQNPGGKFGRQMSLDAVDWKQRINPGQAPQAWSTDNSFNPPVTRHGSSGSFSSMRSSGSSEEGLETTMEKPGQYGLAGRRQNSRGGEEPRLQNFGPPASTYEAWPRQNMSAGNPRMPTARAPRRYSSPVGNGIRSPNNDFWSPQQQMNAVPKAWQTVEPNQFQDSVPPGLRQTTDPWQQSSTLASNSQAQSVSVSSSQSEAATYIMSGGFGSH